MSVLERAGDAITGASLALGLSVWVLGCGGSTWAHAERTLPATLPLAAFPHVWVLPGPTPLAQQASERLVYRLGRSGPTQVQLLAPGQWNQARRLGRVPPAAVVVRLQIRLDERVHSRWATQHQPCAEVMGCYSGRSSMVSESTAASAELVLTVHDAHTQQPRHELRLQGRNEAGDARAARQGLLRGLVERVLALTQPRRERVEVELLEVELPQLQMALALAKRDQWLRARKLIERLLAGARVRELERSEQARVWFNLGQIRRFARAPEEDPVLGLRSAQSALARAQELDPQPSRYACALDEVSEQLRDARIVSDQERARAENFRLPQVGTKY